MYYVFEIASNFLFDLKLGLVEGSRIRDYGGSLCAT